MQILIVEDEKTLANELALQLKRLHYRVINAEDGSRGLFYGREYAIDLAIIDLGLPKLSGIDLVKQLRAADKTYPILVLTARSQWQDKVQALDAGADDYVVKPYQIDELIARIQALLRRVGGWAQSCLTLGPMQIDLAAQEVVVAGEKIELTAYEYKILEYFIHHPGEVISKTVLTEHVYEQGFDRDSNVIEVLVGRLRRKLDPKQTYKPIETVRGRGYRLVL